MIKPTFYLASQLERMKEIGGVRTQLQAHGWICTYDWMTKGAVSGAKFELIVATAQQEMGGCISADVVCLCLPGGFGAHTEFGAALATNRISGRNLLVVHGESDEAIRNPNGTGKINPFYFHENVQRLVCPLEALAGNLVSLYDAYKHQSNVGIHSKPGQRALEAREQAPEHTPLRVTTR